MRYNLFKGLWKVWEQGLDQKFFEWFQDLEVFLQSVLRNGVTFQDHVKGRLLTLPQFTTNQDVTLINELTPVESNNLMGVLLFQSTSQGSFTWSVLNQNLVINFQSSDAQVETLKLFLVFQ